MEKIIVHGGQPLKGTVHIEGAKNAVLPIQAASLLASTGELILTNVPALSDVFMMNKVLSFLNVSVDFDRRVKSVTFNASKKVGFETPFEYVSKMRASIVVMGPLLARVGRARVAMPGGCAIGSRPIDLHLKGFEALGAKIEQHDGYIEASADKLVGANIYLDFPSVGATENIMMAATLAEGTTTIENVAREPEIVDLANVLNKMGAKVFGAGTESIRIEGVPALHGCEHSVVQDRIEAGTFMVAAAITHGDVLIADAIPEHNKPLISKLLEMGVEVREEQNGVRIIGPDKLMAANVKTAPHPGFPTDMQPQVSVLQLMADGTSTLTETVFENRFNHLNELRRMNAHFTIEGRSVALQGPTNFNGAEVAATDLRAAAALVLAGLVANGYTTVTNLKYLDRGYCDFHEKLANLGAEIERVDIDTDLKAVISKKSLKVI
ncbi:MAG: UDP-N-acetylglucosamine 1-carboxyvinyltransferase [Furfurilactobacillus sp.]|jgi:UDP-N-acetylglucosamine 1-carboxyvinyltransferase|uniref:UDP-N-acetylglucosamine 1-carboxyvinyltransferase n=2 Tax=Furfurilactobacillus TaxID=2767882 RepID=A0ABT6DAF5_9LACO|nr:MULTISPECIES: UDP-N-acetylglucosamine 1-carboxyvinyltransferase [Furfurilactobacillus]QLE66972.1 UDP-N-acetylglucosamine 1-carboxyvinyltransferase [Furfurilactobacillus rossiae]MCF6161231.1 UDP-N-acetylglucosamine 1-carboxyvinyltransferase [Furfurilactobacillus milii]MCF6163611.1 UDP-N-acetylglucosamine 1-carboxyvinyltransferase [Furfurilactobacillus milii]MCF6419018.1 UDP-N-acetylglucosamine 1-carboxyvinyltransferase [Furfurilactobacillus milii]MCH4011170.1 UDP-N-acetylglucosamine 1-carbox